jgi:SAM-dependent methyltransferase
MVSTFNARDAANYERSMGRWSRRLAPGFLAFADIGAAASVLDVGCGTGSLLFTLAANTAHTRITGIDAADIYVAAARAKTNDPRIALHEGDACAMPFPDASFDAALSQLVLQFVPDADAALAEMRRVVRPGGTVAAAVWASGGGMPHQRMFWDTAAVLDPEAALLRGKTFTRPMTRPGDLATGLTRAGLADIAESSASIWMEFADFADFIGPIAGGEGTLGKYFTGLPDAQRTRFEAALRDAFLSGDADGPRAYACTAFIARGRVP